MYGKFFSSAFTGSMVGSGADVFAVWGYVIAHTVDSLVELNPIVAGAQIGMAPEEVSAAIATLCAADPNSRNKESDGCRLVKMGAFSYQVVSHSIYRNMRNEGERREYNRIKKQESRARKSGQTKSNAKSKKSAHTEAEAEAEAEAYHPSGGGEGKPPKPTKARKKATRTKTIAHQMPADWAPTESHIKFAKEHPEIDLSLELVKFTGHWAGKTWKSWDGAFMKWLAQAVTYAKQDAAKNGGRRLGVTPIQPAKSGRSPAQFAAELERERIESGQ